MINWLKETCDVQNKTPFQHKSNEETNEITTVWGEKTGICQIRYILRYREKVSRENFYYDG